MSELMMRLYDAVAAQMELDPDKMDERKELHDTLRDIAAHGADAGWPGFTYTRDCVEFYDANCADVWELARDMVEGLGAANVPALVAGFGRADMANDPDGFANLLAWFALEEVARWIDDGNGPDEPDEEEAQEEDDEAQEETSAAA